MSIDRRRPEHLLIREHVEGLLQARRFTWHQLVESFVDAYVELIPQGPDSPEVPHFEPVHRHDSLARAERKQDANLKKLKRKLVGNDALPLCYQMPLIVALDAVCPGYHYGVLLHKKLFHNAGFLHVPIEVNSDALALYSNFLTEVAEANSAIVADMAGDNCINEDSTREEVLQAVEAMYGVLHQVDSNQKKERCDA